MRLSGTLGDEQAIRDRSTEKFHLLAGDLSGIQHTLFLLANQQVKGVNKILRARSFLLGMTVEAAALRCRREFGLPAFNLIQNAGGRFVLLLPALPEVREKVAALQAELDRWLGERYLGELALNLALSPPFGGHGLQANQFFTVQAALNRALDTAKQQALRHCPTGVWAMNYEQEECTACGKRPARHRDGDARRCEVCHDEHRVGGWLPKVGAVSWQSSATTIWRLGGGATGQALADPARGTAAFRHWTAGRIPPVPGRAGHACRTVAAALRGRLRSAPR